MRDLCHSDVAVLGEATHADGHTEAFKVALVERLISQCGFRAVVFEGSLYEFLAFNRARREGNATEVMVGNAIGGLWKFETEFKPLTHFLYTKAMTGRVTLGGMDDQLGGLEQSFTNQAMFALLMEGLPADRRTVCREALRLRTTFAFDDAHPNSDAFKYLIRGCAADMRAALDQQTLSKSEHAERTIMLDGIDRQLRRDTLSSEDFPKDRDRAMYAAFARFAADLPRGTRIIVWTHSFHAAKSPAIRSAPDSAPTFGTLLHQTYGRRAFALAFSARSGSYRWSRKETRPIPTPPTGALELAAPMNGQTAYLDNAALHARGYAPAALDFHTYRSARWAEIYDGIIIFSKEHPPHSTRVYSTP
jgi:erythromycin esterase-like protein